MKPYQLVFILLEWNRHNGFVFQLLMVELEKTSQAALLGLQVSRDFVILDILFKPFYLYDRNNLKDLTE